MRENCDKFDSIQCSLKNLQNIVIIAGIHGNVFLWQPIIMGNKSFFISVYSEYQPLSLIFFNTCPRYLKSRWDLLYLFQEILINHNYTSLAGGGGQSIFEFPLKMRNLLNGSKIRTRASLVLPTTARTFSSQICHQ